MRDFLKAELFYLKKDTYMKGICFILLVASVVLALWLRSASEGWSMSNILEPLGVVVSMSIILYFIIPIQACIFSTEGFDSGTIKNVLSSGISRTTYLTGKIFTEIKVIIWCLIQFYGVFLILYYIGAFITGAEIKNIHLEKQMFITIPAVFYNILYLTAYIAVIFMIGIIVRKTEVATILTFAFIFGDLIISGYWKESSVIVLRTISENSLMTQIFKFSGIYVVNSQKVVLSGAGDFIRATIVPIAIIIFCTLIAMVVFNKSDI